MYFYGYQSGIDFVKNDISNKYHTSASRGTIVNFWSESRM
jgi:hypothetical protein